MQLRITVDCVSNERRASCEQDAVSMFACGFDPFRRKKDDSVAASNHDIIKEEWNGKV